LPLSRDSALKKEFGTRHRAALGLTHETDAVVVVVSEERAEISLAHHGKMERYLNTESLRKHLLDLLDLSKYEVREA
jgi:diadenylate cyclase